MNNSLIYLDVSDLPAPEPLAMIMHALANLPDDQYLHVHHRRYPRLLYEKIERLGYAHETRAGISESCEIFIWRPNSSVACKAVAEATIGLPLWCG